MYTYTYTVDNFDSQCLVDMVKEELNLNLLGADQDGYFTIIGTSLTFYFNSELDASQIQTLDTIIAEHNDLLDSAKHTKYKEIDNKTESLIFQGFTYDSLVFSLSANAQRYWLGLLVGRASITYPIVVNTLDDVTTYSIANATVIESMYSAAMGTVMSRVLSGTALKDQVRAATTVAEVNAIIDNRV